MEVIRSELHENVNACRSLVWCMWKFNGMPYLENAHDWNRHGVSGHMLEVVVSDLPFGTIIDNDFLCGCIKSVIVRVKRKLQLPGKALGHHQLDSKPRPHILYVPERVVLGNAWNQIMVVFVAGHPNVIGQIPMKRWQLDAFAEVAWVASKSKPMVRKEPVR